MESSERLSKVPARQELRQAREEERHANAKKDSVLGQIEDATYEVLRRHEKKSA